MTGKQLKEFLLWARSERISFTTISAGGITLDGVIDGKAEVPTDDKKPEPRQTAYQRFGGALYEQPTSKKGATAPEETLQDD